MTEVFRVPVREMLDWHTGKCSLRETLLDLALNNSPDLQKQEREREDAGDDFWRDRCLRICIEEANFVVYLEVV